MGLDSVEMVMEFEDEFELKIPDEDACRMRTIGDVIAFIAKARELSFVRECPTAHVFYCLRHELIKHFRLDRKRIRPSTEVSNILSAMQQDEFTNRLPSIGMSLPHIDNRTDWWDSLLYIIVALFSIGISIYAGNPIWLFAYIPLFIILWPVFNLRPKPVRMPAQHFKTLGDLSRLLADQYVIKSEKDQTEVSAISLKVRTIVAEQMGYELQDVRESMRLADDLLFD